MKFPLCSPLHSHHTHKMYSVFYSAKSKNWARYSAATPSLRTLGPRPRIKPRPPAATTTTNSRRERSWRGTRWPGSLEKVPSGESWRVRRKDAVMRSRYLFILCRWSGQFTNTWSRPKSKRKLSRTSIAEMKKIKKELFATKNPSSTKSTYA